MTNAKFDQVARLVEDFLVDNPKPNNSDWTRLIDAHPDLAADIADAMIIYSMPESHEVKEEVALATDVFNQTISKVLNLVHMTSSPVLEDAKKKVEAIQGPAARKVAADVGIGPYVALINGILSGRTCAPRRLLDALEEKLCVPSSALASVFQQNFATSELPAYKALNSQPQVATRPKSWETAVRELRLPPEEERRLLSLAE